MRRPSFIGVRWDPAPIHELFAPLPVLIDDRKRGKSPAPGDSKGGSDVPVSVKPAPLPPRSDDAVPGLRAAIAWAVHEGRDSLLQLLLRVPCFDLPGASPQRKLSLIFADSGLGGELADLAPSLLLSVDALRTCFPASELRPSPLWLALQQGRPAIVSALCSPSNASIGNSTGSSSSGSGKAPITLAHLHAALHVAVEQVQRLAPESGEAAAAAVPAGAWQPKPTLVRILVWLITSLMSLSASY